MKNFTLKYGLIALLLVVANYNIFSQTVIDTEDFESGSFPFSYWNSGGSDCFLNSSSILSGNDCANLQDNSGSASSMYTNSINLTSYASVVITFDFRTSGYNNGHDFYIEFSDDGGSSWHSTEIARYIRGTDFNNNSTYTNETVTAVSSSYGGTYNFTSSSRFRFRSDAAQDSDDLYIDNVTITAYPPSSEIDVQGNSTSITDGDATPSVLDYTDFTTGNLGVLISRTYTINNTGTSDLTISSISLSNTTDFSITGTPYASPVATGNSTSFTIQFNSVTLGTKTCTVTVNNNDLDESAFQFDIQARAEQNFFDSDNDGVFDNLDIDDDNDGILDSEEELSCQNSSITNSVNYKFLNETFGTGNRTTINTTYDAITTYCYEDGTVGTNTADCPSLSNNSLGDGEYVVYYSAGDGDGVNDTPNGEVASWADDYWYTGTDHTGDTNGRMAMFNASYEPGTFYTATIVGALPNIPITYSFWVLNLDTTTAPGIAGRLRPDILVEFRDVNNNLLASITTGDIPPSINGDAENSWHQFTANLTFSVSEFYVYFINNETGGLGNDLAIDDIVISQTLCDTDNDGVADVFDLDSDNDGIPDVVEAGLGSHSEGNAMLTGVSSWVDSNGNGMHDATEANIEPDTDGDGVPNYLDLDSDNDTIFDVDESGATNSGNASYQNGDGDITGDGVGDGADTDAVRETDVDSDGSLEYFTDGILDIYDFFEGGSMATAYGNTNQGNTGSGWEYYVADTDNDGTPDYLDVSSDGSNYDIAGTLYASLDANSDGIIDDTNDADDDGILDLFDTDDATFGSPRDLNSSFQLYFDGRNDYASEATVIDNTWSEGTLMVWIKIDPASSGNQIILGQDVFYIQLNADKTVTAYADGITQAYSTALNTNQWIHITATYASGGDFNLYINGNLEATSSAGSGNFSADTSSFTIGRQPDTDSNYFHGHIDEIRIFNKALSQNELHKIVYQEIENNGGIVRGSTIPMDITDFDSESETSTPLSWSNLERYYQLSTYKDDIIDDLTTSDVDTETGAKIYNIKIINNQTAPLPFVTTVSCSGNWANSSNWIQGDIWDVNSAPSNCAIVHLRGNMQTNSNHTLVGLVVDSGANLNVENDSELNISWFLELDGKIDLEGDSQLIQGAESILDATSSGTLEKDQQGTADKFSYNFWSSPVGVSNATTNNNAYTVTDIFTNVTFTNIGYDGMPSPLTIADYWIWKYANLESDNYSLWQHARSTGAILVGEGFTMKGPGSGAITDEANYVLEGKPNNGEINLTISAGNSYLIGNPYPSAIDAHEFILDNGATIAGTGSLTGSLYFWEHWGGGSHILKNYQGGYATYSLAGGVPAASKGTNDPLVGTGGTPLKTPGRYIPVGQGFFVDAESGGTLKFKNSQRIFQKEDNVNSIFVKSRIKTKSNKSGISNLSSDTRLKFRLAFTSVNGVRRQLLTTVDENSTIDVDWGYDALYRDTQSDDMYWMISNKKYTIQGVDEINSATILPLGIHTEIDGTNTITIYALENANPEMEIYLHDKELGTYHDLKAGDAEIFLLAGEYLNRFEISFSNGQSLSDNESDDTKFIKVYYSNHKNSVVIDNPNAKEIKSVEMLNMLGQSMFKFNLNTTENYIEYKANQFVTGYYILNIETAFSKISKKVLIKK